MNRLFQGTFAFVMTIAAISGVSGKEAMQLTDAESRQVVGETVLYKCIPKGKCECAALPAKIPGGADPCSGGCAPGNSCRVCDGGGNYNECVFLYLSNCTAAADSCGDYWDGGFCGSAPAFTCAVISVSTNIGPCKTSLCKM